MEGIPSLGEPNAAYFLRCTRSHSSFSVVVWFSQKSIQISTEDGEVSGWQRALLGCGKDGHGEQKERPGAQ